LIKNQKSHLWTTQLGVTLYKQKEFVGNEKIWKGEDSKYVTETVEETAEMVLDGYPLLYWLSSEKRFG
jgi:hypothetical protein